MHAASKSISERKNLLIVVSLDSEAQQLGRALNEAMAGRLEIRMSDALARSNATTWVTEGVIVDDPF